MADNESSHLMWIIIVIAIAALIFMGLKVALPGLIDQTMDKMTQGVKGIDFQVVERPDENDSKWIVKANYGTNGRFVMDKDGNAVVYAIDSSKPIEVSGTIQVTSENSAIKTLNYIDTVKASSRLVAFFRADSNLTEIKGLDNWDTSQVTGMDSMFYGVSSLMSIGGLSNWDMSNVITMSSMFNDARKLTNVSDLSKWDTSKVTNMSVMFTNSGIKDVPSWYNG